MNRIGSITPHFTWSEAVCRCGCEMPEEVAAEVVLTAEMMERVRAGLDALPINVAAWYRCPSHNAAIGGAPNSQHIYGRGVDFSQKGRAPTEVQRLIRARGLWPSPVRGLEIDEGHTHVDRRPGAAIVFTPAGEVLVTA